MNHYSPRLSYSLSLCCTGSYWTRWHCLSSQRMSCHSRVSASVWPALRRLGLAWHRLGLQRTVLDGSKGCWRTDIMRSFCKFKNWFWRIQIKCLTAIFKIVFWRYLQILLNIFIGKVMQIANLINKVLILFLQSNSKRDKKNVCSLFYDCIFFIKWLRKNSLKNVKTTTVPVLFIL